MRHKPRHLLKNPVRDPRVEASRNTLGQFPASDQIGDNDGLKQPHQDDVGKTLSSMFGESTGEQ